MTDRMSKMGITNFGSVDMSSPVARQRFLDLNKEVVECRVCPRLVKYRESVARVKKKQFLNWNYWGPTRPWFRRHLSYDCSDRTSPGTSRRESNRKSVHRGQER